MAESRFTFRRIVSGEPAWQRQLRDRHLAEGAPPVALDLKRAIVKPISPAMARQVILKYEWLGTMAKSNAHFGIFFGPFCAGVTCVVLRGGTAGSHTHEQFGIEAKDFAVLARGACVHWAPPGTNSKLVSWTARLLAKEKAAKVLMAFADSDAGEIGTIYQACGWTYIGRSKPNDELVAPNSRVYNRKLLGDVAKQNGVSITAARKALEAAGWKWQDVNPKHRYVIVVDKADKELAARIAAMARPYPKRGGSIAGDAPGSQPREGGSNPTPPLHSSERT